MPAPNSILRLLALGTCADVVTAFATIKREGEGIVETISTESAGTSNGCPCQNPVSYWFCAVTGVPSLTNPVSGDFDNSALANYVSACWALCYKNPSYMRDGVAAPHFDLCSKPLVNGVSQPGDLSVDWRTEMCKTRENGNGIWTSDLLGKKVPANPFKDSCFDNCGPEGTGSCRLPARGICLPNGTSTLDDTSEYIQYICTNIGGQSLDSSEADPRTVEEKCEHITQGGSLEYTSGSCNKAMKAEITAGADDREKEAVCDSLYKYWTSDTDIRYYSKCTYNTANGKCQSFIEDPDNPVPPTNTKAGECKALLCGVSRAAYDPDTGLPLGYKTLQGGIRPDDPACSS